MGQGHIVETGRPRLVSDLVGAMGWANPPILVARKAQAELSAHCSQMAAAPEEILSLGQALDTRVSSGRALLSILRFFVLVARTFFLFGCCPSYRYCCDDETP